MRIILLGVLLCIVLFFAGLFVPRRSKRLQGWVNKYLRKGEGKCDENAGKVGDAAQWSIEKLRNSSDKSAEAGRKTNKAAVGAARTVGEKAMEAGKTTNEQMEAERPPRK